MAGGPGEKKQLGKILLKQKLVTPQELEDLLQKQRATPGQRLASTAVQSGVVGEVEILKALSEQHGLPGIDLAQVVIPLADLKLIPADIAKQHLILPILVKEDRIFLAMADPGDRRVIDEIEFVTGRRVFPYVSLQESLRSVIDQAYKQAERGESYYVGPRVPRDYLQQIGLDAARPKSSPPDPQPGLGAGVITDDELGIDIAFREEESSAQIDVAVDLDPAFDSGLPPPAPRAPSSTSKNTKRKVLIVDDEEDIRRLLRRVLGDRGYEVIEASRGLEALQHVRDHVPDLILLDAMLPEVHGFDICRRIKGSKRYGHIPIIMVSAIYRGWRFAEDLRESYGVETFLEKPFKIGEVLSAVHRALEGRDGEGDDSDSVSREAGDALQQGIDAYQGGDLDGAIAHLQRGIGIDPLAFKLHYHLGLLYGRRENIYEAIHELEIAIDLQPRHFPALKNLAVLYQRAGFKHKAIEMWERAMRQAPDDETKRGIKDHLMGLL
jgi:CheY-like chemotaxis protein